MTKTYCDKCGDRVGYDTYRGNLRVDHIPKHDIAYLKMLGRIEICTKCYNELQAALLLWSEKAVKHEQAV